MSDQVLLVVGEGVVTDALASMAELLGWTTEVEDTPREVEAAIARADAVVVTSHHADVDGPAIAAALAHRATGRPAYIGAMGSRRTQARRREWLLAHGIDETALDAVHGPAGLDIGADTPVEIALSILAEVVATTRGAAAAGSLSERSGPIHPGQPPGEAYCPAG
jgi:xanthine dehydrogenase accessory factor